ncbi:hypothetical protein GJ496_003972 [Pomphorhynchus laevis]|nr:hypothetical protein GJ496_003972 [Pomphorhynchus laevis]
MLPGYLFRICLTLSSVIKITDQYVYFCKHLVGKYFPNLNLVNLPWSNVNSCDGHSSRSESVSCRAAEKSVLKGNIKDKLISNSCNSQCNSVFVSLGQQDHIQIDYVNPDDRRLETETMAEKSFDQGSIFQLSVSAVSTFIRQLPHMIIQQSIRPTTT